MARSKKAAAQFKTRQRSGPASELGSHQVLRTKLYPPTLPPGLVPRTHLVSAFAALRTRPLTLVSAPAGYGKSTLAKLWLDAWEGPGVWISLDDEDNSVRSFMRYVLAGIQSVFPESCRTTQPLLDASQLPHSNELTRYLLNDLDEIEESFVLVLDDYHLIKAPEVHDVLSVLLAHPPQGMHLILLTRRDPPLPIHRLRGQNQVNEISVSQLRFTLEETGFFLKEVLKISVDERTTGEVQEKMEGWAAGMRLMSQSLREVGDVERILGGLQGGFGAITDYLVAEVLSRQTPAMAECMVNLSILDRFCTHLVDALRGDGGSGEDGPGGEEALDCLRQENLFLIPLDTENHWYRYHHLFQGLLRAQLKKRRTPEEIAGLHLRASRWFEKIELVEEAIQHALAAGEPVRAAEIVEQNRVRILDEDKGHVLEKWLSMLPESIKRERPELMLAHGWICFRRLDFVSIMSMIESIEKNFVTDLPEALLGELDYFRGYCSYFQCEGARALGHFESALQKVPMDRQEIRGETELHYGLAAQMEGRQDEGVREIQRLLSHHSTSGLLRRTRLLVTPVFMGLISGELEQAGLVNRQLEDTSARGGYGYAHSWSVYLQGLIHYYRNELETAVQLHGKAVEKRHVLHVWAALDAMAGLIFSLDSLKEFEQADEIMELLQAFALSKLDPMFLALAESCRAHRAVLRGDRETAVAWLNTDDPPDGLMLWWVEVPPVTRCRVLLLEGSEDSLVKADGKLEGLLAFAGKQNNQLQQIGILTLLVVARKRQERVEEGLGFLGRALEMAASERCMRPFLEAGSELAPLLQEYAVRSGQTGFLAEVIAAFESPAPQEPAGEAVSGTVAGVSLGVGKLIEPLTRREGEVLDLLARRLHDKEIGAELFISPETVKSHLKSIYQKLEVGSRVEAAERAERLGLLLNR